MTSHYELLYIIPINYTEKKVPVIINNVESIVKKSGGTITYKDEWTKRKIAYPIKQVRHGFFISNEFDLDAANLEQVQRELALLPEVLRFQVTKKKPGAYEPIHISSKEEPQVKEELLKIETIRATREKDKSAGEQKIKKPKINLEDLDEKLDKILEEEL